jgi:hypothetical protein
LEIQENNFNVFPGSSFDKVFEYARSVLDWEMCNAKHASTETHGGE